MVTERICVRSHRFIDELPLQESTAVYIVVAVTAAVEHQRHEAAADHEGENDAEDHGNVAMDAHLNVNALPGINSPPVRKAQKGDEEKKN
jgi:hypothetical protein